MIELLLSFILSPAMSQPVRDKYPPPPMVECWKYSPQPDITELERIEVAKLPNPINPQTGLTSMQDDQSSVLPTSVGRHFILQHPGPCP